MVNSPHLLQLLVADDDLAVLVHLLVVRHHADAGVDGGVAVEAAVWVAGQRVLALAQPVLRASQAAVVLLQTAERLHSVFVDGEGGVVHAAGRNFPLLVLPGAVLVVQVLPRQVAVRVGHGQRGDGRPVVDQQVLARHDGVPALLGSQALSQTLPALPLVALLSLFEELEQLPGVHRVAVQTAAKDLRVGEVQVGLKAKDLQARDLAGVAVPLHLHQHVVLGHFTHAVAAGELGLEDDRDERHGHSDAQAQVDVQEDRAEEREEPDNEIELIDLPELAPVQDLNEEALERDEDNGGQG